MGRDAVAWVSLSLSLPLSEPVRVNLWSSSSFRPSWSANWTSGAASSLTKTLAHFCTPHSHSQIWECWNTGTHHQQWHSQTQDRDSQSKKSSFQLNLASVCIMGSTALNSHTRLSQFCADCRGNQKFFGWIQVWWCMLNRAESTIFTLVAECLSQNNPK